VALLLLVLPGSAVASRGEKTVEPVPGDFVLTSDACPNLPHGTTLTGSGSGTSITRTRTNHSGITKISNFTQITGSATDQAGNRYRYLYLNTFRVSNSQADPAVFSGLMHDLFVLHGRGPAHLFNGFTAVFTTDFGALARFDPIQQFGDPLDFATGAAKCDPL
jgi:hypothetical protein